MKAILTVSSKGQITLPRALRERLGLRQGDRLEATVDEASGLLTLETIVGIEALSERISGYAEHREPVVDVDAYYQAHRGADRAT